MSLKSDGAGDNSAAVKLSEDKKRRSKDDASVHMDREPVLKKPVLAIGSPTVVLPVKGNSDVKQVKPKKAFIYKYGNYRGYYGYRLDASGDDPRMSQFEAEWFQDKSVLDIGCNTGVVAIRVSKRFGCRSMIGVDIDKDLVDRAKKNLEIEEFAVEEEKELPKPETTIPKLKATKFHGGGKVGAFRPSATAAGAANSDRKALENPYASSSIEFEHCNYLRRESEEASFDTIMCLSVIKWVHLNWGDEGLFKLLKKVFLELKPGGAFILEIQPFSSYQKVKNLTKAIRATYDANKIHPNQIAQEAEKIGFTLLKTISPATPQNKKGGVGFARPIHVFAKPIQAPHVTEEET